MRHRIRLQSFGAMLVFRRGVPPADADGWRRLSLPAMPAQAGRTRCGCRNVTASWNVGAVLLDMDGTLLDTEKIYFDSLVAALDANGYGDDAAALCHAMVGLPG